MKTKFNKVLIVRLSAIGDVINTLPALAVLRKNLPQSFIAWVVEDKGQDLVLNHPDLNKAFVFRRQEWTPCLSRPSRVIKALGEIPAFIHSIRKYQFDLALDFQGNLKSGVITYLSGAKMRAGFQRKATREFAHLFTNLKLPLPQTRIHRIQRNLTLLRELGLDINNYRTQLPIKEKDNRYVEEFKARLPDPQKPLVVFHPGTSKFGIYKRWSSANYALLGDRLIEKHKVNLVITWGPGERGLVEEIAGQMKQKPEIDYGKTETPSLTHLTALLKQTQVFVGSDSAPLQLASLCATPTVALFGPKDPVIYGPTHTPSIIIRKNLSCSPCTKRSCKRPDCMILITPEEVLHAVEQLLEKPRNEK